MTNEEVVYRGDDTGGYLFPAESRGQFDIQADSVLIAKGSYFFCRFCLRAIEIEKMYRKTGYCLECYQTVREG